LLDRHSQSVGDQGYRGLAVDRPTDDASAKRIENHGTVHLALASWVLGDVGDPQLITALSTELPTNTVLCRGDVGHPRVSGEARPVYLT
jgi:hypothetical protein